jgi:hypothetical protein
MEIFPFCPYQVFKTTVRLLEIPLYHIRKRGSRPTSHSSTAKIRAKINIEEEEFIGLRILSLQIVQGFAFFNPKIKKIKNKYS